MQDLTDAARLLDLPRLISEIRHEMVFADNPDKSHFDLGRTADGLQDRYANVMPCVLSDNTFGCKVVHVNETYGSIQGTYLGVAPNGIPFSVDASRLTSLRCAVMAAYCLSILKPPGSEVRVAYFGAGRINCCTSALISRHWRASAVVCGSPTNPDRNSHMFPDGTIFRRSPVDIVSCDALFTATNTTSPSDVIHHSRLTGPRLFVSQDGGFILGPSFRRAYRNISDSPTQLESQFADEFPHDTARPRFEALSGITEYHLTSCVYLNGIACADAVVAREMRRLSLWST